MVRGDSAHLLNDRLHRNVVLSRGVANRNKVVRLQRAEETKVSAR